MKVIHLPRGYGKTTILIKMSAENKLTSYRGRKPIPAIYIDEADFILRDILGIEVDAITVTSGHNASICETSQEKNLSFGTALNYAMSGRKIRRSDWAEGVYVQYISDAEYNLTTDMFDDLPASFTLFFKEDICIDWFPTMSDIDSDKWEVVN